MRTIVHFSDKAFFVLRQNVYVTVFFGKMAGNILFHSASYHWQTKRDNWGTKELHVFFSPIQSDKHSNFFLFSLLPSETYVTSLSIQITLRSHPFSCSKRSFSPLLRRRQRQLSSEILNELIIQTHVLAHISIKATVFVSVNHDRTPNHDSNHS